MVARNQMEGSDSPHWWDNLPAQMRVRFSQPITHDAEPELGNRDERAVEVLPPPSRAEIIGDLSRLAGLFVLVACGCILFLLLALSFVSS